MKEHNCKITIEDELEKELDGELYPEDELTVEDYINDIMQTIERDAERFDSIFPLKLNDQSETDIVDEYDYLDDVISILKKGNKDYLNSIADSQNESSLKPDNNSNYSVARQPDQNDNPDDNFDADIQRRENR